jgi:hypothetical protein
MQIEETVKDQMGSCPMEIKSEEPDSQVDFVDWQVQMEMKIMKGGRSAWGQS